MKRILYSLCAGCMMVALTATGAPANKADSKKKGRGKVSAQVVSPAKGKAAIKGGGQTRVQRSVARPRVTSKATSKRASVRTDRGRTTSKPSVATGSKARTSRDVVTRSKGRASREVATKSKGRASRAVATKSTARASRETARTRSARTAERAVTTKTFAGTRAALNREKALARESTLRRGTRTEAARTRTAQTAAARTTATARSNLAANRQRNLTFARNVAINRDPNVRIVNNWRNDRFQGANYAAFYNYNRDWHDRWWYDNNYSSVVLVLGGWWYWNAGYWYPAWGYDPYARYGYDGPIYTGYATVTPDQVIVNVQVALRDWGYYAGPIDGIIGTQTRAALAAFQADNGLAITSSVDQPTLATLGLA